MPSPASSAPANTTSTPSRVATRIANDRVVPHGDRLKPVHDQKGREVASLPVLEEAEEGVEGQRDPERHLHLYVREFPNG